MTPSARTDPGDRTARVIDLLAKGDWVHVDHVWDVSSLWILKPGDMHAIWVSWLPSGEHFGWYVNLQYAFRRVSGGIEAMDLMLDVVVEPDLQWRWKDDDEFAQILALGLFDADLGASVQAEAETVIERLERLERLERRATPFDEPWPQWRPPSHWEPPRLPTGWDNVPTGGHR